LKIEDFGLRIADFRLGDFKILEKADEFITLPGTAQKSKIANHKS
jgi:hypothetical protein